MELSIELKRIKKWEKSTLQLWMQKEIMSKLSINKKHNISKNASH